jgi:NhaP-type Na+/H+ or K+/H+ antiporter
LTLLLVFAVTLVIAVLISNLAEKSVLSVAVLFLAAGFLAGENLFGSVPEANSHVLKVLSELALFSVLFTDGMRTGGLLEVKKHWRFAGRALLLGMPLTILGIAVLARWLADLPWDAALLIGAVISPTDPVFVSAIFRFDAVPHRLKRLLNIESGLNDGLALPIILVLLNHVSPASRESAGIALELALGGVVGVVVPWVVIRAEEIAFFGAAGLYKPLSAFSAGLLVLAICYRIDANLFLGAFTAGVTVATVSKASHESFEKFGELIAELLKVASLLVFGALIAPRFLQPLSMSHYLFVVVAVFGVRFVAVGASLLGSGLHWQEILAAGWFGPKGFASVVYGILILERGLNQVAHLVALMVALSIVVYSSTDILIGRWFERHGAVLGPQAADLTE